MTMGGRSGWVILERSTLKRLIPCGRLPNLGPRSRLKHERHPSPAFEGRSVSCRTICVLPVEMD